MDNPKYPIGHSFWRCSWSRKRKSEHIVVNGQTFSREWDEVVPSADHCTVYEHSYREDGLHYRIRFNNLLGSITEADLDSNQFETAEAAIEAFPRLQAWAEAENLKWKNYGRLKS